MKTKHYITGLLFLLPIICEADKYIGPIYPGVGDHCPDIVFNDLRNFPKKTVSISDFRGKWLVLDCWNKNCSGCVAGLPRIDSLQKIVEGKMQFMLVGYTGSLFTPWNGPDDLQIKKLYERVQKRENLQTPIAFDSVLYRKFNIGGGTFIIVVNPEGIIKGITTHLTVNDLTDFLEGRIPRLSKVRRLNE